MTRMLAILAAVLGILTSIYVAHQLSHKEQEAFAAQLNERASGVRTQIETSLQSHVAALESLGASWETRLIPVRPEWEADVETLQKLHPGLLACELLNEKGRIQLLHPDTPLSDTLGETEQQAGLERAKRTKYTQSVALPLENDQPGYRIFVPMRSPASSPVNIPGLPGSVAGGDLPVTGYATGLYSPAKALYASLSDEDKSDFVFELSANEVPILSSKQKSANSISSHWQQAGLNWRCEVQPAANLKAKISLLPAAVRWFGIALSLLLGLALWAMDLANRRKRAVEVASAKMRLEMNERLKTSDKLRVTEAELRRAQRMEVLGKLTGGIAHEFNNLFTTVNGFQSLAIEQLPADSDVRLDLEAAAEAAGQASDLAGYLLEYSRTNSEAVKPVALNPVLERFDLFLKRAMGQEYIVDMELNPEARGTILTSLFDFQQTLMDVALLAKEHMPEGGKLAIRTTASEDENDQSPLESNRLNLTFHLPVNREERSSFGDIAVEAMRGVDERLRRIGGTLGIHHDPHDSACTLDISFPNIGPEKRRPTVAKEEDLALAKDTHILLVEDDPRVLDFATRILQCMGCNVTSAETPAEALARADQMSHIDLLVTDIALPGVAGTELYDQLKAKNPNLRCLFVSGHEEDELRQSWLRDRQDPVLQKPFTLPTLSRAVASLIEEAA